MRKFLVIALLLVSTSVAKAEFVGFDQEPNNNAIGGEFLFSDIPVVNARMAACLPSADIGIGTLAGPAGAAEFDFYAIVVPAGCIVNAMITPLSPVFGNPALDIQAGDSVGPFAGGLPGGVNNWFSIYPGNNGSAVQIVANPQPDGLTIIAVSNQLSGAQGNYALTVSVLPEPSTLSLLGLGLVALLRRRK